MMDILNSFEPREIPGNSATNLANKDTSYLPKVMSPLHDYLCVVRCLSGVVNQGAYNWKIPLMSSRHPHYL